MLHLFWRELCEEHSVALELEAVLLHIIDLKLLTVVDRIVRIAYELKPNIVSVPHTTGALRCHSVVLILEDLVSQEGESYRIKLEVVQRMLTTHVEQKVNS